MLPDQETIKFFDDRYDARYRKVEDCDDIQAKVAERDSKISLDIAIIKTKLTFIQWLGGATGVAVIGVAVKYLFGG